MSFDKIFDLTAGVHFRFHFVFTYPGIDYNLSGSVFLFDTSII